MSSVEFEELAQEISYAFDDTVDLEIRRPLKFPHRTPSIDLLEICEQYEGVEFEEDKIEGTWIVDNLTLDDLKNIRDDFLVIPEQRVDKSQLKTLLINYNHKLDLPDEDFNLIFLKMDGDFDGFCDWSDFIAYLLYEFQSKETLETTDLHPLELPINENAIVIPSRHRHPIIAIIFRAYIYKDRTWGYDNGKYMTVSTDGALNTWSLDFELERSQYAYYPKEAKIQKTFVTSVACLPDTNLICTATRERDLRFFDISLGNYHLRSCIVGLHQSVTALYYHFYQDIEKSSLLIGGDLVGNILYFKFKTKAGGPFRTLGQHTKNGFFIIKRVQLEAGQIPGLKFKLFEGFQSDWIHQIEWFALHSHIVSCQNKSKNSLIAFDPSKKEIKVRFSVRKGVNVFHIVEDSKPIKIVTGGYDSTIRVWNYWDSVEPQIVLHGHHSPIAAIVVQNKGARIYSLSIEKVFKVWDTKRKACIMATIFHGILALLIEAFHPKTIRALKQRIQDEIEAIRVNMLLKTVPGKLSDLGREIPFICFYNPVYRRFVAANHRLNLLRLGRAVNPYYSEGHTHVAGTTKALYNPIFKCVVTVGMDSNILTWDPYSGKRIHTINKAHTRELYGEVKPVGITSATFGPSLIHLLTGAVDGSVKMWNFTLGICLRELMMQNNCSVTGLYWVPQRLLAMGWNKHVTEWVDEADIGDSKHWPMYHTEDITASAICPPDVIATGTYSGELIFLNLKNGQPYKIHFVGAPNLDNKVGFALNRGYPINLKSSRAEYANQGYDQCGCDNAKKCECDWKCRCLENCDCMQGNKCKCDQTLFFHKEAKEMEDLESMFEGVFRTEREKEAMRPKHTKTSEERKKKKKTQPPMITGVVGRMEIHCMYFLDTREDKADTGCLLASLQNGWIQLWSRNPNGGLVSSFYAIHVVGDYVTAMIANADNSFLFTGHAFGYVKVWHISNYGRAGPVIKKCMPLLRLRFPFLINDLIPGRAKRAARGQIEPMILSSCRNHISKVSHIELIEANQIYITCGLDKAVRFWTYGGQYIGTLGGVLPWPKITPNVPFKHWPLRIPPDLKRVVSSTSLKVLTDCYAKEPKTEAKHSQKTDIFSSDDDDEKRYKRIIEARELKHKIYPDSLKNPILGKHYKLTDLKVTIKQPPKLNLQDTVLRVLNLMKTAEIEHIPKPRTPPYASRDDCEIIRLEKLAEEDKLKLEMRNKQRKYFGRKIGLPKFSVLGRDHSKKRNLERMQARSRKVSQTRKIAHLKKKLASKKKEPKPSSAQSKTRKVTKSLWRKLYKKKVEMQTPSYIKYKRDQKRIIRIIEHHNKPMTPIPLPVVPSVVLKMDEKLKSKSLKKVASTISKLSPKKFSMKSTKLSRFNLMTQHTVKRPKPKRLAMITGKWIPSRKNLKRTSSDDTPQIVRDFKECPKTKHFHFDIEDVQEILDYLENDHYSVHEDF